MSNQILVPSLGESVTEATVSKWLKQVGEEVDSDEPLVELETDKVNIEVPSPLRGTLSSIKVKEGDTVEVGALLGILTEGKASKAKIFKVEPEQSVEPAAEPSSADSDKKKVKKKSAKKTKIKEDQDTLILDDESKNENSNGALILETLAEEETSEIDQDKYQ